MAHKCLWIDVSFPFLSPEESKKSSRVHDRRDSLLIWGFQRTRIKFVLIYCLESQYCAFLKCKSRFRLVLNLESWVLSWFRILQSCKRTILQCLYEARLWWAEIRFHFAHRPWLHLRLLARIFLFYSPFLEGKFLLESTTRRVSFQNSDSITNKRILY